MRKNGRACRGLLPLRLTLAALGLGLAVLALAPGAAQAQTDAINLSILYTGDTHGHLESFAGDGEKPMGGVAKRAIYFQDKRRHQKMTWLTVDSGDALSGTPLSDAFQGHLDIEAMNRLGYDAMCLGVHDFDYGAAVLKQRIGEAKFAVLSANIISRDTGSSFTLPYTIIERNGARLAIFGLTTGDIGQRVAPQNFEGLAVQDPIETARGLVPELRAKADVVIALTHLGVNEDIRLASQVQGIDVICGGMSHSELQVPMKVGQTLVVHDGYWGKHVGLLKMSFRPDTNGRMARVYFDSQLEPMGGRWAENSDYLNWLAGFKPGLVERMSVVIGSSATRMAALKAKSSETDMGNFVCDVLREVTQADAAVLPAAFFRAGLPDGPVTLGDLFTALPYDHYAETLTVTGGELQEILNDSADQIGRPGFPQVSGLSMALFNGQAYNVKVNGQPLDPFARYTLATSDALAEGGSGYNTMGTIKERSYTGKLVRDLVKERLKTGTPVQSGLYQRITFMAEAPARSTPAVDNTPPEPEEEEILDETMADAGLDEEETLLEEETVMAEDEAISEDEAAAEDESFIPDETVTDEDFEADSPGEDTRLDRNGDPMLDEVPVEEEAADGMSEVDETIDEAVDEDIIPELDGPVNEDFEAELDAMEAEAEDELDMTGRYDSAAEDAGDMFIGSGTLNSGAVDYEFSVERVGGEYIFSLKVTNNGDSPASMSYSDAAFFDFMVYDGNNLVWNFNHNRFFMQKPRVEPLGPGEERNFSGRWNGRSNQGQALAPKVYRFEALHLLTEAPVRVSFEAEL